MYMSCVSVNSIMCMERLGVGISGPLFSNGAHVMYIVSGLSFVKGCKHGKVNHF